MNDKQVLIVSYYWPPAGGPGVQRWLKFAKYLPELGWQPTILTPENPSYPLIDESLVKEVSKEIKTIKLPIWEPYQLAEKLSRKNKNLKSGQFDIGKKQSLLSKISVFIRGNFFIPDPRIFWVKPSVKFLSKYLKENNINILITTGPPHSMHLIGLALKKKFPNLKWIADFRDPWTEISYYQHLRLTKFADKKHRNLETKVLQSADITLTTSYTDAKNFKEKGANAICITNGFDSEVKIREGKTEKFTISYIGVLEQLRNPSHFWEILGDISDNCADFSENFELKLVGKIDAAILSEINKSRLKENLNLIDYLPHEQALEEMKNSDLLLVTNFSGEKYKGIIPGKIFEYLATGNSILSFGPKDADVKEILETTKAGKHFGYEEREELKKHILHSYQSWKEDKNRTINPNIEDYSRRKLTQKLSEILSSL